MCIRDRCNQLTGLSDDGGTQGYGYYLSYGNMYLEFPGMSDGNAQNYVRDLDMKTAIASVNYCLLYTSEMVSSEQVMPAPLRRFAGSALLLTKKYC